jgi:hypothetical protein
MKNVVFKNNSGKNATLYLINYFKKIEQVLYQGVKKLPFYLFRLQ